MLKIKGICVPMEQRGAKTAQTAERDPLNSSTEVREVEVVPMWRSAGRVVTVPISARGGASRGVGVPSAKREARA